MEEELDTVMSVASDILETTTARHGGLPLEVRIAALETAVAACKAEQSRQVMLTAMAQALRR